MEKGGSQLKGSAKVQVHYYEDGNVQLNSTKDFELEISSEQVWGNASISLLFGLYTITNTLPGSQDEKGAANAIVKAIEKAEKEYQMAINDSYTELSENTFKELRRALPFTRNKVDWHKILNYKIGSELSNK